MGHYHDSYSYHAHCCHCCYPPCDCSADAARQLGHERVDGLCDEGTVAIDGDYVADASKTALPADSDPDVRKHAAPASSRLRVI